MSNGIRARVTEVVTGFVTDGGGAAAVEFALAALPLLLTIVGVVELGRYAWTVQAVEAVATGAARCVGLRSAACASGSTPSVALSQSAAVTSAKAWGLTLAAGQVTVATSATCGGTGGMAQVTVAYTFAAGGGLVPALASVPVSAVACFPTSP